MEDACLSARPGVAEMEVAGSISEGLWARGVEPITLLVAADARGGRVRHYVPTAAPAHQGFIASLCARRGGLGASATRTVAFNAAFARHYPALLAVERAAFEATKPGAALGGPFGANAYGQNGLPGEGRNHRQGGITGYLARVPRRRGQRGAHRPRPGVCLEPQRPGREVRGHGLPRPRRAGQPHPSRAALARRAHRRHARPDVLRR